MDDGLVRRFGDQQVPRYTSYPTSPHFTAAVGEAAYRQWLRALTPDRRVSLYLHVPFCRTLCWYCGCHTRVAAHDTPLEEYCDTLFQEIGLVEAALPMPLTASHVHWGGGTPTIIGPDRFLAVMDRLRAAFDVAPEAEVAVEIDPRRLDPAMVEALAEAGINRASVGVQSFDPTVQAAINRIQTYDETATAVLALRDAGIAGLNIDLLYGLPFQNVESCRATVAETLRLKPDRLAVFGYAHLPGRLRHQQLIDEAALPGTDARLAQYMAIGEELRAAGYQPIGLDHFARPDDGLATALATGGLRRNFQGYTTDAADALLGFGASAIGALPEGYVQNAVGIVDWRRMVLAGQLPVVKGIALSPEDRLRREVIESLMCDLRVDLDRIAQRHGLPETAWTEEFERLGAFAAEGALRRAGPRIEVMEEARPLLRSIVAVFDTYLDRNAARHSQSI